MNQIAFDLRIIAKNTIYLIGILEVLGVLSLMPSGLGWQISAGIVAFAIVYLRIPARDAQNIAKLKGDIDLYSRLGWSLKFTLVITIVGFMGWGSKWLADFKEEKISNSLEFQVISSRAESAEETLKELEDNNPYSESEIASAQSQQAELQAEIRRLEEQAKIDQNRNLTAVQNRIDAFWLQTAINSNGASTGRSVRSLVKTCPGSSFYHKKYCPQLASIQGGAPLVFPPEVAKNKQVLSGLQGVIAYQAKIEHAKNILATAKQEQLAWLAGVENKIEVYPAPYYRLAELLGAKAETIPTMNAGLSILVALFFVLLAGDLLTASWLVDQEDNKLPEQKGFSLWKWLKELWVSFREKRASKRDNTSVDTTISGQSNQNDTSVDTTISGQSNQNDTVKPYPVTWVTAQYDTTNPTGSNEPVQAYQDTRIGFFSEKERQLHQNEVGAIGTSESAVNTSGDSNPSVEKVEITFDSLPTKQGSVLDSEYIRLLELICTGRLTSSISHGEMKKLGFSVQERRNLLRVRLVKEGIAHFDDKGYCVLLPKAVERICQNLKK